MPLKHRHPLTPNNPTGNTTPLTASLKILCHNRYAKYTKTTFFHDRSPTVCPIDFRSTAIDASQTPAPSAAGKPDRKYYFPQTASLKTPFHSRQANYTKNGFSTTAHPPYVPSTSGRRQSIPLKHRHPLTPKNPTENTITLTASLKTPFHNRQAKYTKSGFSTTSHPPYVPSTSGRRQSMPLKHRHPLTPKT
jgi:hypothetical protein